MILSQDKLKNRAAMLKKFMKVAVVSIMVLINSVLYYTLEIISQKFIILFLIRLSGN